MKTEIEIERFELQADGPMLRRLIGVRLWPKDGQPQRIGTKHGLDGSQVC